MKYFNAFLNLIFGWYQYRVRFDYKKGQRVVFSFTTTIGVREQRMIDNHRLVKKGYGPLYHDKKIPRALLNNGTIVMEPLCYLGRWKTAH